MKKLIKILAFWILCATVALCGMVCLFGISLLDGTWSYMCILGAVVSFICLFLLMDDKEEPFHYNR
jgi:hypothetical protein